MSKPLQVYLDEEDYRRIEEWAKEKRCTKSQAVRIAVRNLTRSEDEDPVLAASGFIDGLPRDLSSNVDRYLVEALIAETPSTYRRRRRRSQARVR